MIVFQFDGCIDSTLLNIVELSPVILFRWLKTLIDTKHPWNVFFSIQGEILEFGFGMENIFWELLATSLRVNEQFALPSGCKSELCYVIISKDSCSDCHFYGTHSRFNSRILPKNTSKASQT